MGYRVKRKVVCGEAQGTVQKVAGPKAIDSRILAPLTKDFSERTSCAPPFPPFCELNLYFGFCCVLFLPLSLSLLRSVMFSLLM